jgi:hypothetical protein
MKTRQKKSGLSGTAQEFISSQLNQKAEWERQQEERLAQAKDREELQRAWEAVHYHLEPDGSAKASVEEALQAISRLYHQLEKRGLLDKLTKPPTGVQGDDLKTWQFAREVLRISVDDPGSAIEVLTRLPDLAGCTVREWLCKGFRKVIDGTWQTGPLIVEITRSSYHPPLINAAPPGSDAHLDRLNDRQKELLGAVLRLGAVSQDRGVPVGKAARKADPGASPGAYKTACASLVRFQLLKSKKGPNGGIWLTDTGKSLAERLSPVKI